MSYKKAKRTNPCPSFQDVGRRKGATKGTVTVSECGGTKSGKAGTGEFMGLAGQQSWSDWGGQAKEKPCLRKN